MGFLNSLFGSTESLAKKAKHDEEIILSAWEDYRSTIAEKEQLISQLPTAFGARLKVVGRLNELLKLELADVHKDVKEENDIISELLSLEHSKRIAKVHRLESCLGYAETRYKYTHGLFLHLYATLKSEAILLKKISKARDLKKYRDLISKMGSELTIEKTILEKIDDKKTIPNLLAELVRGEHIIAGLDAKAKRIVKMMRKGARFGGITDKWFLGVLERIDDRVLELIAKDALEGLYDKDLEFVNRPEFVEFVKDTIKELRGRGISEPIINAFVHLFREQYNERE